MRVRAAHSGASTDDLAVAWYFARRVLLRDWRSLLVTLTACSIAAVIATFQYAVYDSFLVAASAAPRAIDAQLWVTAAGVECFDFPDTMDEDYAAAIQRFIPGATVRRVVFGFAPWRSPEGRRNNAALVGVDGLPVPPRGFEVDRSDLARMDLAAALADQSVRASIADVTLDFAGVRSDLATFLGVPYVFVRFEDAREILRMGPATTSYLALDLPAGAPAPDMDAFRRQFPELTVRSGAEFEHSSARYWERKTGAGLAILLAAGLAIVLMVFLLTNGAMRFAKQYEQDFLSLIGHGAGRSAIGLIVAIVSAGLIACAIAISAIAAPFLAMSFRRLLPWVGFRASDMAVPAIGGAIALAAASAWARKSLAAYGPEAVFRS